MISKYLGTIDDKGNITCLGAKNDLTKVFNKQNAATILDYHVDDIEFILIEGSEVHIGSYNETITVTVQDFYLAANEARKRRSQQENLETHKSSESLHVVMSSNLRDVYRVEGKQHKTCNCQDFKTLQRLGLSSIIKCKHVHATEKKKIPTKAIVSLIR